MWKTPCACVRALLLTAHKAQPTFGRWSGTPPSPIFWCSFRISLQR